VTEIVTFDEPKAPLVVIWVIDGERGRHAAE
jgi:hypothetical protein